MGGFGLELALDDDVGFGEALLDIAMAELMALGDIGGLARLGPEAPGQALAVMGIGLRFLGVLDMADLLGLGGRRGIVRRLLQSAGEEIVMQDRRIGAHRRLDVGHMGQDLVIDLDELQGLAGNDGVGRGDARHRMTFIEHLVAGHHIAQHVAQIRIALLEVVAGDDGLDARQGQGLGDVDGADPRMGMGAAQDLADEHGGGRHVGAELGPARDLVQAVRAQGARADDGESVTGCDGFDIEGHQRDSRISAAALVTARTILS